VSQDLKNRKVAMVFAGGLSLAAYHAGAYEVLVENLSSPSWVTGASAGAITAAIIAGNPPEDRMRRLKSFWNLSGEEAAVERPWDHAQGWISAISAHLFGSAGYFHPRVPLLNAVKFQSLYDLAPMRRRLASLIDFDRLNNGSMRISIAATDVESGDPIIFDSRDGPIEMDHLMASCGFLPEFAPVDVNGRCCVDGGFSINAPFDPILDMEDEFQVFVLDLYARDGARPHSLEAAAERKTDLMFGNQTFLRLKDKLQIRALSRQLSGLSKTSDTVFLLSYRAAHDEPGPEKSFSFSRSGLVSRWRCGRLDMLDALSRSNQAGLHVIRRRAPVMATQTPSLNEHQLPQFDLG
jgi:NTE family protein